MPFSVNNDVFIVSQVDTGEITDVKSDNLYVVKRDSNFKEGDHHEVDLHALPWKGRIFDTAFFKVIQASKDPTRGRQFEVKAYRKSGGRIR